VSHANGEVILGDCVIGYFEYDGTSDVVAGGRYYDTREEVYKNWRKQPTVWCEDGEHPKVGVFLYTDYAYGYFWPAVICPTCNIVTEGRYPSDELIQNRIAHATGIKYYWDSWPLDGHPLRVGIQDISYDWSWPCEAES